jgi:hypothetical protein
MKHLKSYETHEYHEELNPLVWSDFKIDETIRLKLIDIAKDYYGDDEDRPEIKDIQLIGSLCNYNYNKFSDFDVHISIDFSEMNDDIDLVREYFDVDRLMWNFNHDITIKGYEVELYVEDIHDEKVSSGVYSLLNNKWLKKPKYAVPTVDQEEINFKYNTFVSGIDKLEELYNDIKTPTLAKEYYQFCKDYRKKISRYRKFGLADAGEYSTPNLVFKKLRNSGHIKKILDLTNKFYDKVYTQ